MPSLKEIRKRIGSVKSTQKITRAMKMVAGARLNRAQQRITELRPYALKTKQVLREVTQQARQQNAQEEQDAETVNLPTNEEQHPLLDVRPEKSVLLVVMTSDRGLCGGFNTAICKMAERQWREREAQGQTVSMLVIGRKGADYFTRRGAPLEVIPDVWNDLDWDTARPLAGKVLGPFLRKKDPVDAVYFIYNEFKSAMTQDVVCESLLPIAAPTEEEAAEDEEANIDFLYEPNKESLFEQLVPMYVQVSIVRALFESMASELGARMTAMDAATNNAGDMIDRLTLQYNRARQAAITKELMEIIGGSEALKG